MSKKKGDIEWTNLGDFSPELAGLEVGLRHEGPGILRDWHLRLQALRLEELRRVVKLREGLSADAAPEFYDGLKGEPTDGKPTWKVHGLRDGNGNVRVQTPEGVRSLLALAVAVVAEVISGARGVGLDVLTEGLPLAEEMARLGVIEGLMQRAMEVQSLTVAARFPAEGAGDPG